MIWLIVLAVWLLANVIWNYRTYKEYGFIRVSDVFEALFVSPSMLILTFHNWMENKFEFWNYPLFMNKELKSDIDYLSNIPFEEPEMIIRENGKDVHFTAEQIAKLGNELIEEVKAQAIKQNEAKNETGRKNGTVRKNTKKKN